MSKEAETQPYRNFKEFLDTIIKMPEDLKNRLANEFERRRLEDKPIFDSKKDEEEDTSIFGSKKDEEDKSIFADMFSKKDEEEDKSIFGSKKEEEVKEDKSIFTDMFSKKDAEDKTDAEDKKDDDKSFFNRIFSKEESDELIKKFSEPNAAPLKKCQIRPW